MISRARKRLGRRGVPLLLLGAGHIGWGVGWVASAPDSTQGLSGLLAVMPLSGWAAVWVAAGLVALSASLQPVGRDRWGYVAAVIPPGAWALGYFYAAVTEPYPRGAFVGMWYLVSHALFILWASGIAEYELPRWDAGGGRP